MAVGEEQLEANADTASVDESDLASSAAATSILAIEDFQKAVENFLDAIRLIIVRDEIGNVSVIEDSSNNDSSQNQEIIDELRKLIPSGIADDLLYSNSSSSISLDTDPLSSVRLKEILKAKTDSQDKLKLSQTAEFADKVTEFLKLQETLQPKNVFRNQQSDAIYLASGYFFKGLTYPLGMPQPFKNQPETNFLRQLADF